MDFDVVVLGTGLSESITAAALSKAGFKVAHVDNNQYYGGDEASLTLDELAEWADSRAASSSDRTSPSEYFAHQRARYSSISRSSSIPSQSRQYAAPLAPSVVPAIGPHIDSLIASGVSRYGSFKLLEKVAVYDRPGFVQSVPGSKEDVFKSKALSLMEKRRLMRFLVFAAGEFEGKKELEGKEQLPFLQFLREVFTINDKPATAIVYALAFCASAQEPTLPALQRIRQYLRSAGRYGASPFLVGHYGGMGETAQGFCRTSAVKGGTYILGRRVVAVKSHLPATSSAFPNEKVASAGSDGALYTVELEDFNDPLTAKIIVTSSDYMPTTTPFSIPSQPEISTSTCTTAICIAAIDKPLSFTPTDPVEETPDADVAESEDGNEDGQAVKLATPSYEVDTAILVFPPGSLVGGSSTTAAHALVTGEGSMAAPRGRWIINISLPLPDSDTILTSTEELLRPYLDAALTLTAPPSAGAGTHAAKPLFTTFYAHHHSTPTTSITDPGIIVAPSHRPLITAVADEATQNAEGMFWKAVEMLGMKRPPTEGARVSGGEEKGEEKDVEESGEIDSFWPPLDVAEVETSDDW